MRAIAAGEEHLGRTRQWHQSQARLLLRDRGRRREKRKGKRKERKKIQRRLGLGFTRISSRPPSAGDPRVMDLRVARVEPDHRSSAYGRARDLIGDEISARAARRLFGASGREEEAPLRHSTAARSPSGERARRQEARAAPPARSLRRRSGARNRRCGA
jgi:hypothetical protein